MHDAARGERIKARREELKRDRPELTQPFVAAEVGVTYRAYQAWEAGGGISDENKVALARILNVTRAWIDGPEEETPDLMGQFGGETDLVAEIRDLRLQIESLTETVSRLSNEVTSLDVARHPPGLDSTSVEAAAQRRSQGDG